MSDPEPLEMAPVPVVAPAKPPLPAAALTSDLPMPPDEIRYRVVSRPLPVDEFLRIGWFCQQAIVQRLAEVGRAIDSFGDVLDWGVGCCRVLRHFHPHFSRVRFSGTDIDEGMIAWDRANVPGIPFQVNGAEPPLPWPDNSFDFVYGISVFTHLDEPLQAKWLAELRRVARPGGLVLLTTHGRHVLDLCKEGLRKEEVWAYKAKGFVYVRNIADGVLPDWYQTTFQTEAHIRRTFGEHLTVLTHVPRGMSNYQDATLLRNDKPE